MKGRKDHWAASKLLPPPNHWLFIFFLKSINPVVIQSQVSMLRSVMHVEGRKDLWTASGPSYQPFWGFESLWDLGGGDLAWGGWVGGWPWGGRAAQDFKRGRKRPQWGWELSWSLPGSSWPSVNRWEVVFGILKQMVEIGRNVLKDILNHAARTSGSKTEGKPVRVHDSLLPEVRAA